MQAYDLVKLRSTASCRIVGIAAASEGGAVAGVIGKRQSRMIGELDLFLSGDFLTPFASSRKDRRSPTTGPAGRHRRQVTRIPPRAWVRAPTERGSKIPRGTLGWGCRRTPEGAFNATLFIDALQPNGPLTVRQRRHHARRRRWRHWQADVQR